MYTVKLQGMVPADDPRTELLTGASDALDVSGDFMEPEPNPPPTPDYPFPVAAHIPAGTPDMLPDSIPNAFPTDAPEVFPDAVPDVAAVGGPMTVPEMSEVSCPIEEGVGDALTSWADATIEDGMFH